MAKIQCGVKLDIFNFASYRIVPQCRVQTEDDEELAGHDQLSKVEGWIRGNTMVGPVLEVAVNDH